MYFPFLASIISFVAFWALGNYSLLEIATFSLLVFTSLDFVEDLGNSLPILKIISFSAVLQLLFAPIVAQYLAMGAIMPIPLEDYLSYAVPGVFLLCLGIYLPLSKRSYIPIIQRISSYLNNDSQGGLMLFWTGFLFHFLIDLVPSVLYFFFILVKHLMYIGALYIYFSNHRYRIYYISGALILTFFNALNSTLFWHVFTWLFLVVAIISIEYKPSRKLKYTIFLSGIFGLLVIQSVKRQYRAMVWFQGLQEGKVATLVDLSYQAIEQLGNSVELRRMTWHLADRLNQGYWDALTLRQVPAVEEFANGKTIVQATLGSLLPRFVWKDKPMSGTELFVKYTGHKGLGSSYMSISPLAEGYINFGRAGGLVFLLIFGFFLGTVFSKIVNLALRKVPTLVLWTPLIFYQVIRIETDMTVLVNHLVKALLFTYIIYTLLSAFKLKV